MKKIHVQLTTKSRMHIADSANPIGKRTCDSKLVKYTQTTKTGIPVVRMEKDGKETASVVHVPVINANLIRGRIRRNIASRIIESIRSRNERASVVTSSPV